MRKGIFVDMLEKSNVPTVGDNDMFFVISKTKVKVVVRNVVNHGSKT